MLSAPLMYAFGNCLSVRRVCYGCIGILLGMNANAQYKGGGDDGHTAQLIMRSVLTDPVSFRGGSNDGVSFALWNRQQVTDGIAFLGGTADGTALARFDQQGISSGEAFNGGPGSGFALQTISKQILTDPLAMKGGEGAGFVKADFGMIALSDPDAYRGGQDDGQASRHIARQNLFDPAAFTGGTADGFVVSGYAKNAALPVLLTGFTAQWDRSTALLKWTSGSEINLSRFRVERSFDGTGFSVLDSVAAKGSSSTPQQYELADKKVAELYPATGTFFYRLRSVDTDGKSSLSAVVVLSKSVSGAFAAIVYPNPANAAVHVSVNAGADIATMRLVLTDMNGRVLLSRAPTGTTTMIQTSQFIPGQYYLSIFSREQRVTTIPLIIQH